MTYEQEIQDSESLLLLSTGLRAEMENSFINACRDIHNSPVKVLRFILISLGNVMFPPLKLQHRMS